MGVSYNEFWSMNPHIINIISNGYQEKMKMQDSQMWFMGMYIHSAVSTAIEHNLYGKKAKQEYLKKPILQEIEENNKPISEEEIQRQREAFATSLAIMAANFELNKERERRNAEESETEST